MMGAEDTPLSDRLRQVEEAAHLVQSGAWPLHRFEEALGVWLGILAEQQGVVDALPADPERDDTAERVLGREGLRMYREGLERMLCFASDRNPQHLREGLDLVRDGNDRLNHALRLNPDVAGRGQRPPGTGTAAG